MLFGWIQKLFSADSEVDDKRTLEYKLLSQKIEQLIDKNKQDSIKLVNEKERLQKWAIDAIFKVFFVPAEYWYNELDNFELICNRPENQELSYALVQKCKGIVKAYLIQISIRDAKLKLCSAYEEQFAEIQQKFNESVQIVHNRQLEEDKLHALNTHEQRLKILEENNNDLDFQQHDQTMLKDIEIEMIVMNEKLKLQLKFEQQMAQLNSFTPMGQDVMLEHYQAKIEGFINELRTDLKTNA